MIETVSFTHFYTFFLRRGVLLPVPSCWVVRHRTCTLCATDGARGDTSTQKGENNARQPCDGTYAWETQTAPSTGRDTKSYLKSETNLAFFVGIVVPETLCPRDFDLRNGRPHRRWVSNYSLLSVFFCLLLRYRGSLFGFRL